MGFRSGIVTFVGHGGIMVFCLLWLVVTGPSVADVQIMPSPGGEKAVWADLVSDGSHLWSAWIEREGRQSGAVQVARFDGSTWGQPVTVATGKALFINWADFVKIAVNDQRVMVAWPQMVGEGTYAYALMASISEDGGKTFSAAFALQDDLSETEHGFVSLAPQASGFRALWLDGRKMVMAQGEGQGHGHSGSMELRTRLIEGTKLGPEKVLDDKTCECCGTDLIVSGNQWWAIYRDQSDAQIRDIYLVEGKDQAVKPGRAVFEDAWTIHGCPVNGPAFALHQDRLAIAWFSGAEAAGVRLALLNTKTGKLEKQQLVSAKSVGRVDCSFDDKGNLLVTCIEDNQIQGYYFDAQGQSQGNHTLAAVSQGRASGFPRVVSLKNAFYMMAMAPSDKGLQFSRIQF